MTGRARRGVLLQRLPTFTGVERWETVDEVLAALAWYEATIPDWTAPRAHGLVVDGSVVISNLESHLLPAAVLAHVIGHDGSTAAIAVTPSQLADAIRILAPAEACDHWDHPNLRAWRDVTSDEIVAIYVGR